MTVRYGHIKAYLIGVSHADIALVLARHVTVDGINIFRADQLIHWNVNTHTQGDIQIINMHTSTIIHPQTPKGKLKGRKTKTNQFPIINTDTYIPIHVHTQMSQTVSLDSCQWRIKSYLQS